MLRRDHWARNVVRWGVCITLSVAICWGALEGLAHFPWGMSGSISVPFSDATTPGIDVRRGTMAVYFESAAPSTEEELSLFTSAVVFLSCAVCFLTYLLQRRQRDRYSAVVLVAMALGSVGGITGIDAAWRMASSQANPGTLFNYVLLQISVWSLGLSASLAGIGLVALVLRRSSQRGRMIAAFLVVWGGYFSLLQRHYYLYTPGLSLPDSSIEIPAVSRVELFNFWDWGMPASRVRKAAEFPYTVDLDDHGKLTIGGVRVDLAKKAAVRNGLVRVFEGFREFNSVEDGHDSSFRHTVWYRIDGKTRFSDAAALLSIQPEFPLSRGVLASYEDPRGSAWGMGFLYFGLISDPGFVPPTGSGLSWEGTPSPIVVEVVGGTPAGGLEYQVGDIRTRDLVVVLQAIWDHPNREFQAPMVIIRAKAGVEWGAIAALLANLQDHDSQWFGFDVLE